MEKEQYGKQLEETRNENERLRVDVRTMKETPEEQKEQHETLLQQAREETETMVVVDNEENVSLYKTLMMLCVKFKTLNLILTCNSVPFAYIHTVILSYT